MTNSPITPSEGLVASLRNSAPHGIRDAGVTREIWLINHAYQSGADQELEACVKWVSEYCPYFGDYPLPEDKLRAARRPKPPSLKEQALAVLENEPEADDMKELVVFDVDQVKLIRRALEALDD